MKDFRTIYKLMLISMFVFQMAKAQDKVIPYVIPEGIQTSTAYTVKANGDSIPVHAALAGDFANFSFTGNVKLTVTLKGNINHVDIRPKSKEIEHEISGKSVSFILTEPAKLSVEINHNWVHPLFIFANSPLENKPSPQQSNVHYYEAGKVHRFDTLLINDNETVFIEGGAVVQGSIKAINAENVKIYGRGVLDGSFTDKHRATLFQAYNASNLNVSGIVMMNGGEGTLTFIDADHINVDNVKIVSWRINDDGINFYGSQNALVNDCFVRSKDNCVGIRCGDKGFMYAASTEKAENITVTNSVFLNAEWGHGLCIGPETTTPVIKNITFKGCDIIRTQSGAALNIRTDSAHVKDITYKNIRVEDARYLFINFTIDDPKSETPKPSGQISNIVVDNVDITGGLYPLSQIKGNKPDQIIRDIVFTDIDIIDKSITKPLTGNFVVKACEEIVFE